MDSVFLRTFSQVVLGLAFVFWFDQPLKDLELMDVAFWTIVALLIMYLWY